MTAKALISFRSHNCLKSIDTMAKHDDILKDKYPAKAHAKQVVEYLKSKGANVDGVLYLEGQKTHMNEDNDQEAPFR